MATLLGQTVSHYKILEHLGGGGMGIVYKAQDLKLDRLVALKFLPPDLTRDPEAKQRFVHEAKAASALQHTNICVVHDIDETPDGQLFISMEYLEGETLRKKIERGPLKIDEAIDLAIQVARGLTNAHEHRIVHRDIKPANIMITSDGVAKIVDFGLAKLSGRTMLTKKDSTLGTAAYMSPEQARGEPAHRTSDIWSLGVVLYEMLTGKRPFEAEYENALLYSILNAEPEPITGCRTGVPVEVERIACKCMAKQPLSRYQHADELVADLQAAVLNPRPSWPASRQPASRLRNRTLLFGLLAGLAVVTVAVWMWLRGDDRGYSSLRSKSIAVLPVSPVGRSLDDTVFAEGVHDDILTHLSKVSGLRVIARTSMVLYRDSKKSPRRIGDELEAGYLLESSVRRAGGKIRISAQLISTADEGHVWADTYDRNELDRFEVQSDIARSIAAALRTTLTGRDKELLDQRPTRNVEAYDFYLKGNYYWDVGLTQEENEKAVEMYEKAVELDPGFALAYARLSKVHSILIQYAGVRTPGRIHKSKAALERAAALAPELGEVQLAEGEYYYSAEPDSARAFAAFERAVETEPHSTEILYSAGSFLLSQGKVYEANKLLIKMAERDPAGIGILWTIASSYFLRDFAEAERWSNMAILSMPRLDGPYTWKWNVTAAGLCDTARGRAILDEARRNTGNQNTQLELRIAYFARDVASVQRLSENFEFQSWSPFFDSRPLAYEVLGRHDSAVNDARREVVALVRRLQAEPIREYLHIRLGIAYAILGMRREALAESERAMHPGLMTLNWGRAIEAGDATIHILLGDYEEAIARLEYLLSVPSMVNRATLRLHPVYDPLRNNPRFQALLARAELM